MDLRSVFWRKATLASVLLAAVVGACGLAEPPFYHVGLFNDTEQPISVYYAADGRESFQATVQPDLATALGLDMSAPGNVDHCTTADLVFRSSDGVELGRLPPPICGRPLIGLSQCVGSGLQPPPACVLRTPRPTQ